MIQPKKGDEGRAVLYARADPHRTTERGIISSWNEKNVFVRYSTGDTAAATNPEDLEWLEDVPKGVTYRDATAEATWWRIT